MVTSSSFFLASLRVHLRALINSLTFRAVAPCKFSFYLELWYEYRIACSYMTPAGNVVVFIGNFIPTYQTDVVCSLNNALRGTLLLLHLLIQYTLIYWRDCCSTGLLTNYVNVIPYHLHILLHPSPYTLSFQAKFFRKPESHCLLEKVRLLMHPLPKTFSTWHVPLAWARHRCTFTPSQIE